MANLPQAAGAVGRVIASAGVRRTPAAGGALRTVGESRIDPTLAKKAATHIASLPAAEKSKLARMLGNKPLMLGGAAVTGGALIGYGADELLEIISGASPDELTQLINAVDPVSVQAGDAVTEAYNSAIRLHDLDRDYSVERSDDLFLSQAPVSGLGLDRAQEEIRQTLVREFANVRRVFTFPSLISLQFLLAHATAEDLNVLEDMYNFNRR